jgi:hypothetical protein
MVPSGSLEPVASKEHESWEQDDAKAATGAWFGGGPVGRAVNDVTVTATGAFVAEPDR